MLFFLAPRVFYGLAAAWVLFVTAPVAGNTQPLFHSLQHHQALSVVLSTDAPHPFSVAVSPAAMANERSVRWALGGEQRFLAPGWMELSAALTVPVPGGSWSLLAAQEGLSFSVDQMTLVTHARKITQGMLLGVSVGVNRKKASRQSADIYPITALGITIPLGDALKAAVAVTRFFNSEAKARIGTGQTFFRCMLGYEPTEKLMLVSAVGKESHWPASGTFCVQYRPDRNFGLSAGFSGYPAVYWFGLTLGIGSRTALQLYTGVYPLVGVSNGMSFFNAPAKK